MRRRLARVAVLLALLALAVGCGSGGSQRSAAPQNRSASLQATAAGSTGWTRPLNVTPLTQPLASADSAGGKVAAGEGKFTVISNTPWPGQKVRVFFFGVQA